METSGTGQPVSINVKCPLNASGNETELFHDNYANTKEVAAINKDGFIYIGLTHWGRDKFVANSRATFSNAFSWMKMNECKLEISTKFVPGVQINTISVLAQIPARLQAIIWTNDG